jgi:hypothetical protein
MATNPSRSSALKSTLSFRPLIGVLKKMIADGMAGAGKLYQHLIDELQAVPELLEPIENPAIIEKHQQLVETLLSTIFPPSTARNQGLYAITYPFQLHAVYGSRDFNKMFVKDNSTITLSDRKTNVDITKANISLAYNVILNKLYSLPVSTIATSVHPFTEQEGGLTRHFELKLNAQFVTVKTRDNDFQLPKIPEDKMLNTEDLRDLLPLEAFEFEGIVVIDATDVTERQIVSDIKTVLLNINAFSDVALFDELQLHVQNLISLNDIRIGITPFFRKDEYYLYNDTNSMNSLLFIEEDSTQRKNKVASIFQKVFAQVNQPILFNDIHENNNPESYFLKYYLKNGASSLILCPLKCEDGKLIGLLEILSEQEGKLKYEHLARIEPAVELFALALQKMNESLEIQIDKSIKEHFTAIQPAVEWKFIEAAFNHIQLKKADENARMPQISFTDVFPLYGSIDIRNSSVERSNCIQLDLLEQLTLAQDLLKKASKFMEFPFLKETQYRIDQYIASATDTLLSDDEMQIHDFIENQLNPLFSSLSKVKPELSKLINSYFSNLDPQTKVVYYHRKNYEESITKINDVLDRFIDQEQMAAQEVYPHYFERYVTDGIEFNIYVGQSLSPEIPFNEMYVRNLKLWQLTFLAKAARLTNALEKRLPMPLQTTQLILAHAIPLSISFRKKERKFDVDGAYNMRYEIVKKRIDKVHIRESEERLTQPGKIAIVYSQQKEMQEYIEYIEFLQHEKLLGDNVEYFELEDTQGISGLKGLRVDVNFTTETNTPVKEPFTRISKEQYSTS